MTGKWSAQDRFLFLKQLIDGGVNYSVGIELVSFRIVGAVFAKYPRPRGISVQQLLPPADPRGRDYRRQLLRGSEQSVGVQIQNAIDFGVDEEAKGVEEAERVPRFGRFGCGFV